MSMNQWLFEYYALKQKEKEDAELTHTILRKTLVSVLGLDIIRPAGPNGVPKTREEMTEEEREAYLPLTAWCARPDMLKPVVDQIEAMSAATGGTTDVEYEAMCAAIDAADGDIEPILGLDVAALSVKTKDPKEVAQLGQLVTIDVEGKI